MHFFDCNVWDEVSMARVDAGVKEGEKVRQMELSYQRSAISLSRKDVMGPQGLESGCSSRTCQGCLSVAKR
jgi:hypothetical protein